MTSIIRLGRNLQSFFLIFLNKFSKSRQFVETQWTWREIETVFCIISQHRIIGDLISLPKIFHKSLDLSKFLKLHLNTNMSIVGMIFFGRKKCEKRSKLKNSVATLSIIFSRVTYYYYFQSFSYESL